MNEIAKDILGRAHRLEPFPDVALRVLELAAAEDAVPDDLIEVIQIDAAITAKVLRLCNSAYYGFQRAISSLQEAGNALGKQTLVNLVLTSCTNRYFKDYGGATQCDHERLWLSSITNAIACRLIARRTRRVDPERAYTVGLLQNIGHLLLDRFLQEERERIRGEVEAGRRLLDAERAVCGVHHAEIGARLATHWGLPDVLIDTIRHHHTPKHARHDVQLASTAHLAETLAWGRGAAEGSAELPYAVATSALEVTGLTPSDFPPLSERLGSELTRARELLEV